MCLSGVAGMGPLQRDKSPERGTDEGVAVWGSIRKGVDGWGKPGCGDLEETVEREAHTHVNVYLHRQTFLHPHTRIQICMDVYFIFLVTLSSRLRFCLFSLTCFYFAVIFVDLLFCRVSVCFSVCQSIFTHFFMVLVIHYFTGILKVHVVPF